ncbi:MAG: Succinate dehydrogenase cytochrome b558 subunit [Chlamydiae bacterium]|nr:Succinate dehydrogenase cytochrome b558 subunit [Chlamydiota bacterium]
MASKVDTLPQAFIWRRVHSLTGLWFVIFLMEHLITNSQAALLLGDNGVGFVRMVNLIHDLPYLTVIEVAFLGIPILIHTAFGIRYALTARPNSMKGDGSKPYLKYSRNRAYTWQRITSWILVVLLIMHVVKFRFLDYPDTVNEGTTNAKYFVTVTMDPGLYTVAQRLGVELIDPKAQEAMKNKGSQNRKALEHVVEDIRGQDSIRYSQQDATILQTAESYEEKENFNKAIAKTKLKPDEVIVVSPSFGKASLLSVRDTFKSWIWVGVYTVFVLCACFHAFNGLWTSMLTWGWVIKSTAQTGARKMAIGLMLLIAFLGLAAVWGTYFLNLKH